MVVIHVFTLAIVYAGITDILHAQRRRRLFFDIRCQLRVWKTAGFTTQEHASTCLLACGLLLLCVFSYEVAVFVVGNHLVLVHIHFEYIDQLCITLQQSIRPLACQLIRSSVRRPVRPLVSRSVCMSVSNINIRMNMINTYLTITRDIL